MNSPQRRWYQEPWVWLMISLPLAAVIGSVITAALAFRTSDGLVVDDYYQQGLEINRVLDRDSRATELGIRATLQFTDQYRSFRLILDGKPGFVPPAVLQISFLHATRSGFDQNLRVTRGEPAIYPGALPGLVSGKWHVQIEAEDWRVLETLIIP